jgi:TetR/AcrR family transcriptional regulator
MPIKDCQTEKLILDTAMRVFFVEGRMQATTQEIADAAGVNRTLINYHFRSKKELLDKILKNALKELTGKADAVFLSNLPFKEKTEKYIDEFLTRLIKYPYLESFLILKIIQESDKTKKKNEFSKKQPVAIQQYLREIEIEMKAGRLPECNPAHFLMNLLSLIVYPFITKPLQMKLTNISDSDYDTILRERKGVILNTIFHESINS